MRLYDHICNYLEISEESGGEISLAIKMEWETLHIFVVARLY
jgi:hypothetical protein